MIQTMKELREACLTCTSCQLESTRTKVVFGVGNEEARVLFIGEGPGENEDKQGEPFVGRAGQLLDKMLEAVDLSRKSNIYIANMVKCRPPKNRDPLPEEVEQCIGYLRSQVTIIKPAIIVCLGRIAAQYIIDKGFKVTQQHGEWFTRGGIQMMGTFHPAALLRNPGSKPQAFQDFIRLRDKINELCPEVYANQP